MKKWYGIFLVLILAGFTGPVSAQENALRDMNDVPSLLGDYNSETKRVRMDSEGNLYVTSAEAVTPDRVNIEELNGATINVNGGAKDAGTMTITLATDDPAVLLLISILADSSQISGDVADIEALSIAANALLTLISTDTSQISGDVAALEVLSTAANALLTLIQTDSSQISGDIAALEILSTATNALLASIYEDTQALTADTTSMISLLTAIQTDTASASSSLISIDGNIATIATQTTAIATDTSQISGDIAAMEILDTARNAYLDAMEVLLTAIRSDTAAATEDLAAMEVLLTYILLDTQALTSDTSAMVTDLAAMETLLTLILGDTQALTSDTSALVVDAAAMEALLILILADTQALTDDTANIATDTRQMSGDIADIETLLGTDGIKIAQQGAVYVRKESSKDLGTGVLAYTTNFAADTVIKQVLIHASVKITEDITITFDSTTGPNYDTILAAESLSTEANFAYLPGEDLVLMSGDELLIGCTDTYGTGTVYVTVTGETMK